MVEHKGLKCVGNWQEKKCAYDSSKNGQIQARSDGKRPHPELGNRFLELLLLLDDFVPEIGWEPDITVVL